MQCYASMVYAVVTCLFGVEAAYCWLSDWTHLQWALHSWHIQQLSAFSAMRGGTVAVPNLLWGGLVIIINASLTINIIEHKRSFYGHVTYPMCRSVSLSGKCMWQNGSFDPNAIWADEWDQSRDRCIRCGW